ncbi:uncharacterized protein TRIADDRAFT_54540 [Trichoplax adhaerens]|uniref:Myb-like domain-containing protein n=1 Tax=Trichoplax adhaerens TaxID=10228 RepID=B3RSB7_TRIAD|nr:hypothetical protein TRIADDRAFT_54540 [Trichoplax adhaerens]EDV27028.1 hypothetical protein TRIADDRAFT_54540 [Trichoplax adhaerens]|eukprot:XP_002111024.1 hypothetical protein TRIADDRAFT_54540 [Trichoplax adhaerens]
MGDDSTIMENEDINSNSNLTSMENYDGNDDMSLSLAALVREHERVTKQLRAEKECPKYLNDENNSFRSLSDNDNCNEDTIAKRTRSQCPLDDLSLEELDASTDTPDTTPELPVVYSSRIKDESDEDDTYWREWLKGAVYHNDDYLMDDNELDDVEYNFLTEQEPEEIEEFRNDKAVRISQREIAELFDNLEELYEISNVPDVSLVNNNSETEPITTNLNEHEIKYSDEAIPTPISSESITTRSALTIQQRSRLQQQLNQRSLTYVFSSTSMLSYCFKVIYYHHSRAFNFKLELEDGKRKSYELHEKHGLNITESIFNNEYSNEIVRIGNIPLEPSGENRKKKKHYDNFSFQLSHLSIPVSTDEVMKQQEKFRVKFTTAEDSLLAIGLSKFNKKWNLIHEHLLPTKTAKQIRIRCKNLASGRSPDNIVKHYYKKKELLPLPDVPTCTKNLIPQWYQQKNLNMQCTRIRRLMPLYSDNEDNNTVNGNSSEPNSLAKQNHLSQRTISDSCLSDDQRKLNDKAQSLHDQHNTQSVIEKKQQSLKSNKTEEIQIQDSNLLISQAKPATQTFQENALNLGTAKPRSHYRVSTTGNGNRRVSNLTGVIQLQPDPLRKQRTDSFASAYLTKVKATLQNDKDLYLQFLETLTGFTSRNLSPKELYDEVQSLLHKYPELLQDFIGFLEPQDAKAVGMFMENLDFSMARNFLRKVEIHFEKNPVHFQKIIKCFSTWLQSDQNPSKLHQSIINMLKGQKYLIDEFNRFFKDTFPPANNYSDFEETEILDTLKDEEDYFEEVDLTDGREGVNKNQTICNQCNHRIMEKNGVKPKFKQCKCNCHRQNIERKKQSYASTGNYNSIKNITIELKSTNDDCFCNKSSKSAATSPSTKITNNHPLEITVTEKSTTDERNSFLNADKICNSSQEVHNHDDGNNTATKNLKASKSNGNECVQRENSISSDEQNTSQPENNTDETDEENLINEKLHAQNHTTTSNGDIVVMWTKDCDREILRACQGGFSPDIFNTLAMKLNRTESDVKDRFKALISLYQHSLK